MGNKLTLEVGVALMGQRQGMIIVIQLAEYQGLIGLRMLIFPM